MNCDTPILPKEVQQYSVFKYDTLQLTLLFDEHCRLSKFWLQRPSVDTAFPTAFVESGSLVIPLRGAFGIRFNSSYEQAKMILGDPGSYSFLTTDTGTHVRAAWAFRDRMGIDLIFMNDSLVYIDSDVKWAKLPGGITVGTGRDSVLSLYGNPSTAGKSKSWTIEPLRVFGVEIWLKAPQKTYEVLYYWEQGLQLNLSEDGLLEEWVLRKPYDKKAIKTTAVFDSSVIPNVGAFGVFFNTSADTIKQVFGACQSYGWLDIESVVITFMGWEWDDGTYVSFELSNDSLSVIRSNVRWVQLPNGIGIGETKAEIIKSYGKPSHVSKIGIVSSDKTLQLE